MSTLEEKPEKISLNLIPGTARLELRLLQLVFFAASACFLATLSQILNDSFRRKQVHTRKELLLFFFFLVRVFRTRFIDLWL